MIKAKYQNNQYKNLILNQLLIKLNYSLLCKNAIFIKRIQINLRRLIFFCFLIWIY